MKVKNEEIQKKIDIINTEQQHMKHQMGEGLDKLGKHSEQHGEM